MKGRIVFGALLVSVVLCSQGFGFDLLDNLLGLNRGCTACGPCYESACCEPKCCTPEPKCCTPEPQCCETGCETGCETCCSKPSCDLFGGLKDLFCCKKSCCEPCCEPACCEPKCCTPEPACCTPEPACCTPEPACCTPEPACCEPQCCEPSCRKRCTPILDFLDDLCCCLKCCKPKCCGESACCQPQCCEPDCYGDCGTAAPAKAIPAEEAAPLPKAPRADPSASMNRVRSLRQASRSLARN